jgi:hypothetical protein
LNFFIVGSIVILFITTVVWKVRRAASDGGGCSCDSKCTGTCRCKELNQDDRRNSG